MIINALIIDFGSDSLCKDCDLIIKLNVWCVKVNFFRPIIRIQYTNYKLCNLQCYDRLGLLCLQTKQLGINMYWNLKIYWTTIDQWSLNDFKNCKLILILKLTAINASFKVSSCINIMSRFLLNDDWILQKKMI